MNAARSNRRPMLCVVALGVASACSASLRKGAEVARAARSASTLLVPVGDHTPGALRKAARWVAEQRGRGLQIIAVDRIGTPTLVFDLQPSDRPNQERPGWRISARHPRVAVAATVVDGRVTSNAFADSVEDAGAVAVLISDLTRPSVSMQSSCFGNTIAVLETCGALVGMSPAGVEASLLRFGCNAASDRWAASCGNTAR